jgi:hypothetical protein
MSWLLDADMRSQPAMSAGDALETAAEHIADPVVDSSVAAGAACR